MPRRGHTPVRDILPDSKYSEKLVTKFIHTLMFGGKKIPELMKGLGRGIKDFKDASKGVDPTDQEKK